MKSESVEELFAALLELPREARKVYLSTVDASELLKQTALRLVNAFESKSTFLNDDFLSDLSELDPDFFQSVDEKSVFQEGDRIGNYVVDSVTGEGGMSVVYRATQSDPIERVVALKLIRSSVLAPKTVLRFFREQQALALVCHPNIATLYEVGTTTEGHPFAAMEYVDGPNILEYCRKDCRNGHEKIRLLIDVCHGLQSTHRHGIIHRDVKPENILIGTSEGRPLPKLIDFGIAKFVRGKSDLSRTMTQLGQVLGSPRYMSPEQIEGQPVDQRTDVYSTGLVLFELLTHSPYRQGDTAESIISFATRQQPELLSERVWRESKRLKSELGSEGMASLNKLIRCDLDWVLAKALARSPEDRYASMDEFIEDLQSVLMGNPVQAVVPSRANRTWRMAKSNLSRLAIIALIGLLATSAVGIYKWRTSENELTQIRQANRVNVKRNAASNDLLMALLASNQYQLIPELFDLSLIPRYQGQYEQIKASGGPRTREDKAVYGILAVLYAMSGGFDQADQLLEQVDDAQQRSELRQLRKKICSDYAKTAKEKLDSLGDDAYLEKARQQLTLGRCYVVLEMLDDAKRLIKLAIEEFDSHQESRCDSLVARNSLIKVYGQAGQDQERKALLIETYDAFKDDSHLRSTQRGRLAFRNTRDQLAKCDPEHLDPSDL